MIAFIEWWAVWRWWCGREQRNGHKVYIRRKNSSSLHTRNAPLIRVSFLAIMLHALIASDGFGIVLNKKDLNWTQIILISIPSHKIIAFLLNVESAGMITKRKKISQKWQQKKTKSLPNLNLQSLINYNSLLFLFILFNFFSFLKRLRVPLGLVFNDVLHRCLSSNNQLLRRV